MTKLANALPFALTSGFLIVAAVTWKPRNVFLAGLIILNLAIVKALKEFMNASRPRESGRHCHSIGFGMFYGDDFGMPSGHVQTMMLITVFIALLWYTTKSNPKLGFRLGVVALGLFVGTVFVAINRVTQKCHTLNQVLVGAVLGVVIATGGFYVFKQRRAILH